MSATTASQSPIPGIPQPRQRQLDQLFAAQPRLEAVWLFGSRAMDRHREGSDIDLCLEGDALAPVDRLRLMAAVDELLLPWQVDLVLKQELPQELLDHLQRVGQCIWRRAKTGLEAKDPP